jgi:ribosomal protein S25
LASVIPISPETSNKRKIFFQFIFGATEGYVCLARLTREKKTLTEEWFKYPSDVERMSEFVEAYTMAEDIYFCPQVFTRRTRQKEFVKTCPTLWADLDDCDPKELHVAPSIVIETSPARYQALWDMERPVEPDAAEETCRRIAYKHRDQGADITGWDLTQLLRVPWTYNHKYGTPTAAKPVTLIVHINQNKYHLDNFDMYPEAEGFEYSKIPFPESFPDKTPDDILREYRTQIHPRALQLYVQKPDDDWSRALFELEMLCFEGGMSLEETYMVAKAAACNKYERDGRSKKMLWKDVCRVHARYLQNQKGVEVIAEEDVPPLLTDEERAAIEASPTLVEQYIEWAREMGDAAWQYHQVGGFVILSSLLAGTVRLPTSYGSVIPNLWFMILADTTLTRKTTSMDMAMDFLLDIDPEVVLATDGSIEGLMTSLSMRPGRPSIFLRDEFSGLLEAMGKKDYYAGMGETLTKLYDGKFQKRILRKETIEVRDPILIIFAGGIKTRIQALLNYEHVASGFLPRFCFVTAESDISQLRPLGPPTDSSTGRRDELLAEFTDIYKHFTRTQTIELEPGRQQVIPKKWDASLTPDAWARYNKFEADMLQAGLMATQKDLMTPTMDRLSKSGLKAAVLIACMRKEEEVVVTEEDVVRAFYYIEQWRHHTFEVLNNIGKSMNERELDQVMKAIKRMPGIHRSVLMRHYHLTAVQANMMLNTLEERGLISVTKSGKTQRLYPTEAS